MLKVDEGACSGCKLCEKTCPFGAIVVVDGTAEVQDTCVLCGACVNACPEGALIIERREVSPEELAAYSGVLVWAEYEERKARRVPKKVVLELLSEGRRLADALSQELAAVYAGHGEEADFAPLFSCGAERVIRCRHPLLERYHTDSFTNVISAVISRERPSVFLLGATPNGRDLAPRVAARLRLGLTADCTGLDIDEEGRLVQTRPAFGGNIMASIVTPYTRPQMATVRPNVFRIREQACADAGRIEDFQVTLPKTAVRTRVIETETLAREDHGGIENADVIVSAGRGCQKPENLDLIRELARELGGVMAGSRAVVELGWIPHTLQVGQSGTTVSPQLYIAVGISGAVQHVVGMSSSRTVVAVNRDPEAPIFKVADFGIVGDALEVLPALIKAVREAKARNSDACS